MVYLEAKPIAWDENDETLYRSKLVSIGSKKITTPTMAIDHELLKKNEEIAPATKGLNEVFCRLESSKKSPLDGLISNEYAQASFNSRIESQLKRTDPEKEMTLCFLEYAGKEKYPEGKAFEFILDTAHVYSDIVPLPLMPNLTRTKITSDTDFQKYKIIMELAIEHLNSFNKKPIMGVIPRLAYKFMTDLINFYIDKEINAFYIDFENKNPLTFKQNLLACFRTLNDKEIFENCFIHAHNVTAGRLAKGANIVNAKDILSYGFGFDSMGRRHRGLKPPKEGWKQFDKLPNRLRLFNKDEYAYYKILNTDEIKAMYPSDSSIQMDAFTKIFSVKNSNVKRFEKLFNLEQLGLEAFRLKNFLKDFHNPKDYLNDKSHVKKQHIKEIKNFRDNVFSK